MSIRSDPEAIDAPWLTAVLEAAGIARGAAVVDVAFLGYVGTGQLSRCGRLSITWDDPEDRPATLVGKFASADASTRDAAFASGAYRKEWTFYHAVASSLAVRAPRCAAALYDPDAPGFVLLLEDLIDSEPGDQLEGLDADRVALAVEQAAALHASRSGDQGIGTLLGGGLPAPTTEEAAAFLAALYRASLPAFTERLGDRLDPEVLRLAADLQSFVTSIFDGIAMPSTIVHLDFRADNLLFGLTEEAPAVAVVDWQTVSEGPGSLDLAYLIGGSFSDPARRAATERDLVDGYRERLVGAGVEVSTDDCWRAYRVGTLWGMVITVIATAVAEHTERGDDLFTAMARRHTHHALDLEALSLLR